VLLVRRTVTWFFLAMAEAPSAATGQAV
jgi:hypothetical protein